ncbi:hypothetical protein KUV51_12620 [Tateyamaria omphalii]|uniref:hypothetical protein n=1 Tax=Tateyamaria omphalii TaxID=299262 RepID=UPI001C99F745|nr:hypothetical protein [Tateyamaria omphalii]MBY5933846.1 hypothetical protein [Tateyamaria omphalii]
MTFRNASLIALASVVIASCSSERRPDIPSQENFPPVGLAASAAWLDNRQVTVAQRPRAADIPTEDLCDIVDDCLSFASAAQ